MTIDWLTCAEPSSNSGKLGGREGAGRLPFQTVAGIDWGGFKDRTTLSAGDPQYVRQRFCQQVVVDVRTCGSISFLFSEKTLVETRRDVIARRPWERRQCRLVVGAGHRLVSVDRKISSESQQGSGQ